MRCEDLRNRHADLALRLAGLDQRVRDAITQRPYLLNPYPSIVTRLARRNRRFRQRLGGVREPRRAVLFGRPWQAALELPAPAGTSAH